MHNTTVVYLSILGHIEGIPDVITFLLYGVGSYVTLCFQEVPGFVY